jgi:hypothetical protein
MCSRRPLAAIVLLSIMPLAEATAASLERRRYAIPTTGLSVDVPISIFEEDAGATEGTPSFYEGLPGQPDDQVVS